MAKRDGPTTGDWERFWREYPKLIFHRPPCPKGCRYGTILCPH